MNELLLGISLLAGEPMDVEQELISPPVRSFHRITHMVRVMRNPNRMQLEMPPTQEEIHDLMQELIDQDIRDTNQESTQTATTRPHSTDY